MAADSILQRALSLGKSLVAHYLRDPMNIPSSIPVEFSLYEQMARLYFTAAYRQSWENIHSKKARHCCLYENESIFRGVEETQLSKHLALIVLPSFEMLFRADLVEL